MTTWEFVIVMLAMPVALFAAINPRRVWWALSAWQYRDPDANEPSDASYAWMRVLSIASVVLGIVVVIGKLAD